MANTSIFAAFERMWQHIVAAHEAIRNMIPTNLVNGSAAGSLRGVGTTAEDDDYMMGSYAFAEGSYTTASGNYSHAEGRQTIASGFISHAEGARTVASGETSHAEGFYTTASRKSQHTQGEYNVIETGNQSSRGTYAHIVGNGTGSSARSNAHTLDWDGNAWFAGDVYVGSTSGTNKDDGSKKLATEEFVETEVAALVGSAPETLDTIEELATALNNNKDIIAVLNDSITTKANKTDVYTKAEVDAAIAAAIETAFANIARAEEESF